MNYPSQTSDLTKLVSGEQTRLSYNCAHLRWTKETLTIEYFRIVLKKDLGENFFGLKTFGMTGVTGGDGGDW